MAIQKRRRIYRDGFSPRELPRDLTESEIQNLLVYLDNPVKSGIWTFTGKFDRTKGIFNFLARNSGVTEEKDSSMLNYDEINFKESVTDSMGKISFIFYLFGRLCGLDLHTSNYGTAYDRIDLDAVRERYKDALDFFRETFFYEQLSPSFIRGELTVLKDGYVVLFYEPISEKFELVSLEKKPVSDLKEFFDILDICTTSRIKPVYSPEERVFKPYFVFLESSYKYLIDYEAVERPLEQSINEYRTEKYAYCISTIGLIAESYMTQIYETYFRDFCPNKLTLGQLYDEIDEEIRKRFTTKAREKPNIDLIFSRINSLVQEEPESQPTNEKIGSILREILHFVKEDRKFILENVEKKEKKNDSLTLFPRKIRDNIFEIIKNRNAVSHNSRVPIGYYEALKTAYCCITLITWWQNEQKVIDWNTSPEIILESAIKRNSAR